MLPIDRAAKLRAAAEALAASDPLVSDWLRAAAEALRAPDPAQLRRILLHRIWRQHWPGMAKTTAARLMAQEWSDWRRRGKPEGLPGSVAASFAGLDRAGVRPIAERQIGEDLDDRWRPVDCIFLHAARPDGPSGA